MKNQLFSSLLMAIAAMLLLLAPIQSATANEDGARAFASNLADKALAILKNGDLSASGKQNKLEALFSDSVDLEWVGKFVLGKHWRAASQKQQKDYMDSYKTFVIRNFTGQLTDYSNQDYEIKQSRPDGEKGEYLLTFEIRSPNEPPVYMDYRVREKAGNYQIFDIIIEGVSLIATQRSEFNAVVERKGLDHLIAALEKKA